jgi:hypothetical protein
MKTAAETANVGEHGAAKSAARHLADGFYRAIRLIDINSRVSVPDCFLFRHLLF